MKLLYGDKTFFIGAVKFFDAAKDFGFIASNNCNMPSPKYNQDFYVNSNSFLEEDAKKEGRVVVFQVEKQGNGKKRAVNVRRITKSDDDIQLALSYYGDHEYIEYKDNRRINLYTHTFKPIALVAERVQHIIVEDPERSPEKTVLHFKFFVEHYKKEERGKDRYIFDRQFATEEKNVWVSLLSVFNDDERIELLNTYPSVARYFDNPKLLQKWIESYLSEDCSLIKIRNAKNSLDYLPDSCINIANEQIESIVDAKIKEILKQISMRSDIDERDLITGRSQYYWDSFSHSSEAKNLLGELRSYKALTTKKFQKETQKCIKAIKENRFRAKLANYKSNPSNTFVQDSFFELINNLSEDEIEKYQGDITEAVSSSLENLINQQSYFEAASLLGEISILRGSYVSSYKTRLLPLFIEKLTSRLQANINNIYRIECDVLSAFDDLRSLYDPADLDQIIQKLLPVVKETTSLYVLSEFAIGRHQWLSVDQALSLASIIVSSWQYDSLKGFIESEPDLFDNNLSFSEMIVKRAVELVGNIPLKKFFDGTPVPESPAPYYSRNPERENCTFLRGLKRIIPEGRKCHAWENYIQSRNAEDLIVLFENDVIESLPDRVVANLIDSISLDFIYGDSKHWYEKPNFKNPIYRRIFETTNSDLVTMIGNRLGKQQWTHDNIPLAVFLVELMASNKPIDNDYYKLRNWESNFKSRLGALATNQASNKLLTVVLWAVHFQTKSSMSTFSEMFASLPPYIQIRCVKKLFQLIDQEKISYTAEGLYNLVSCESTRRLCFPLEIAFAYLKLREKDTTLTLNNNVMLQLMEGSDDHMDWVGIRQMMTQCFGRWMPIDLPDDYTNRKRNSYFNGIIKKINANTIRVFIPYKMVDEYGNQKDYNNKFLQQAMQLIKITYGEDEYNYQTIPQGACYDFDISYEVDLFSIARAYNFLYNGCNNYLGFEKKEDQDDVFCECRLSNNLDNYRSISFYWCGNKPCFRPPIRYMLPQEWEQYTLLDFMRILKISADYTNRAGNTTKFGHYIILSAYLKSFAKFYDHLSCRICGKLMKPKGITNFTTRAVTEFSCANEQCEGFGRTIYLNHCFNKKTCNATIDSRDSKTCPNEQYICPECGACCSTENFRIRINNLRMTGGYISDRLLNFVQNNLGHWEKREYFCYRCGKQMNEHRVCPDCGFQYKQQ